MTLGQQIYEYRKKLGLSQEMLGERLGVSRQAVSKWETNTTVPDMENLIRLSREFGISVAELTETPERPPVHSKKHILSWYVLIILCPLLISVGIGFWILLQEEPPQTPPEAFPPMSLSDTPIQSKDPDAEHTIPVSFPKTDFALLWYGTNGDEEFLELGVQETFFPFGTTLKLTSPAKSFDTDFGTMTSHQADCGAINIGYYHIQEDQEQESIYALTSIVSDVRTPRGIHPGSTKAQVLAAYGDELVYCMKEDGGYTFVKHDYYYAFQTPETFGASLQFFMLDGMVAGIRVEHMAELGSTAFAPNHISRFPLKNGVPDYSQRQEPEQEVLSDTRKVYIAWNQLVTNNNLSAEEQYAYRRDVFSLLPYMDWSQLGMMGETNHQEDTIFALMNWIASQNSYSSSEILWIQMGCTAQGIDGAYADMYAYILSRIFFYKPTLFAQALSSEYPEETKWWVLNFTAYDAELHPAELAKATDILQSYRAAYSLTQEEAGWVDLLLLYLSTPIDDRPSLPKSPNTPS